MKSRANFGVLSFLLETISFADKLAVPIERVAGLVVDTQVRALERNTGEKSTRS